jgi:hypothetical protein
MTSQAEEKAERIRVLLQDKSARDGTTYAERAAATANDERGGRFAGYQSPAAVVKGGPDYPRIPSGPWSEPDPTGQEPSLGYSVDQLEGSVSPPVQSDADPSFSPKRAYTRNLEPINPEVATGKPWRRV